METPAASTGDDRLSELPDHLLGNILSRLTSLQAARTSALSRRWRHLWRAVPCVDIDQREFRTSEAIDEYAAEDRSARVRASDEKFHRGLEEWDAFEDLADTLLPPGGAAPPLDALRLRGLSCVDFRRAADRWIRRGLRRRPVAFHLSCDNDIPFALHDEKFPHFPGVTLPRHAGDFARRLRAMRISGVTLSDDFAGCIAADFLILEDLHLEDCQYGFRRLASQSLRNLSIDRCWREPRGRRVDDVLAIAAPRIAYLRINGRHPPPVTATGEMLALIAASLENPAGELGLLRSLRHARSLDLSGFSATALLLGGGEDDPEDFPVLHNLRTLLLDGCDVGVECQVLRRFLCNAPSLETLTLRDCAFSGGSRGRKRKASSGGKKPCSCPTAYECKNLKSIELEFGEGHVVDALARALVGISKQVARPMENSVQDRKRRVKISYT